MTGKRKKLVNPVVEMEWRAAVLAQVQDGVCAFPVVAPVADMNITSLLICTLTDRAAVLVIHFAQLP